MSTSSRRCRASNIATGCSPLRTPLANRKSIPLIMKSENNSVSRRKNLFWGLSSRGSSNRSLSGIPRMNNAVDYNLNRHDTTETYLESECYSFTNNLSENAIHPFAVRCKNWLFSSSISGATACTLVCTMIEMAETHKVNIYEYLKFLLAYLPSEGMTDKQLANMSPWSKKLQSIKNCM